MKRKYNTGTKDDITVFIGKEIEHTPAYGMDTLFIVGVLSTKEINEYLEQYPNIEHIFFGANHSYDNVENIDEYDVWEHMIMYFLSAGYLCSLDIPLSKVDMFNESGYNEFNNFIPQIRIPIPYVSSWNYNTMIKIDDKDFNHSNPGVWTHRLHNLQDDKCFTSWDKYSLDTILK